MEGPLSASLRRSLPALLLALVLGTACAESLAPDRTITRVTLTPVTASLGVGGTQQLAAIARNRKSDAISNVPFTFESLQPAIATVNNSGLVTGVAGGAATIRATTGTFTATTTITVQIPVCANAAATTTIATVQTITGTLTTSDCVFTGVGYADGYRFVATAPTTVLFTLTGATIRPKLSLTGTLASSVVNESWSSTLGDTVRLVATVSAGTYTLWVVADTDDLGAYSLKSQTAVECTAALATTPIALDQTVNGALTATSCFLPNNAEGMGWALSLTQETAVRFDIGANGFAPWVVITDSNLGITSTSIPVGADSAVLRDLIPAGNYRVWATTVDGGQGTFTLKRSTAVFNFCDAAVDTISVPGNISGSLSVDDCVLEPGFLADPIHMQVAAPTTLRIDLISTAFDTFLAIADSTDTIVFTNDDGGSNTTNSSAVLTFPAGRYTLLASSYSPNESGNYILNVSIAVGIREGINEGNSAGVIQGRDQGSIRLTPKPRVRARAWPAPANSSPRH